MYELKLELDNSSNERIKKLMCRYNVKREKDIFERGLSLLKLAADLEDINGELIVRIGTHETKLNIPS